MCEKPLHTRFNRADGFITIYNGIRYLVFGHFGYDKICDKIKYLFSEKSCIANGFNHNIARTRIDSYNSLPMENYS